MPAITLRNLSPELGRVIRQHARAFHTSLNRAVISLLEERVGLARRRETTLYHDLDHLAGSWTKQEAAAFEKALARQRAIDEELWQR
jgi:hypothetical protein